MMFSQMMYVSLQLPAQVVHYLTHILLSTREDQTILPKWQKKSPTTLKE
jgi:hypothetical protein